MSAAVGDRVVVESSTSRILTAAAVVYVIPLVLFFAFYAAAALLHSGETAGVLAALVGFCLGVAIAMAVNRVFKRKDVTTFEIVEILGV